MHCTKPAFVADRGGAARGVQEPQPERQPAAVAGALLAHCAGVYAVAGLLVLLLWPQRRARACPPRLEEVPGMQLPAYSLSRHQALALLRAVERQGRGAGAVPTGGAGHPPAAGSPAVSRWLVCPQHSPAPAGAGGASRCPCRSIHGQSMLPALPAALQLAKTAQAGLLAAFCCPRRRTLPWSCCTARHAAAAALI